MSRLPSKLTLAAIALIAAAPVAVPVHAQPSASPASVADDSIAKRVDALFAEWNREGSPGAALAVIRDGAIVYAKGYGSANLEHGIPIRPNTVFHIASVSKHFTAFAVHLLAAEGKLSLDDPVRKHVPELHDFGAPVTIRQLMHHTSGIRDQWELLAMSGWRLDDVITTEHIVKALARQRELNFAPGSEHLYSNSGYTLMAEIVRRVSGESFREFTTRRIFAPLGMTRTHFHDDHGMIVPDRAYSYAPVQGKPGTFRASPLNYANAGATSLFTTVEDMAAWERNWREPRVGTRAILDAMHTKGVLTGGRDIPYAHGLVHGEYRGLRTVSHGGADAGYRTMYLRFPDQGYAFVVFSNLGSFNPGRLAYQVADLHLAGAFTKPAPSSAPNDSGRPPRLALPERVLAPKAAVYYTPNGNTRRVAFTGGMLRAGGLEIAPLDSMRFQVIGLPARTILTFEGPAADRPPTRMTEASEGSPPIVYQRAEPVPASALAEYAGTYASDELETRYTLVVRNDTLVARHQRHHDVPLASLARDRFLGNEWYFRWVAFDRDPAGRVTGFRLTGGRVRNLGFTKVADH